VLKDVHKTENANDRKGSVEMSFFPRSILLATDGSDEAKLATQAATELSKETGSEVHVVYTLPTPAQLIGHHLYSDEVRESLIGGLRGTPRSSSKSRRRRSGRTAGR
jgi:hypothetical protein